MSFLSKYIEFQLIGTIFYNKEEVGSYSPEYKFIGKIYIMRELHTILDIKLNCDEYNENVLNVA